MTIFTLLDAPRSRAFPQNTTSDTFFYADGFGDMEVVDVNRDGNLDFVLSDSRSFGGGGTVQVYLMNPTVNLFELGSVIAAPGHKRMIVDDVDQDGRLDVVLITEAPSSLLVYYQRVTGGFGSDGRTPDINISVPDAMDVASGGLLHVPGTEDLAVLYPGNVTVYPSPYNPQNYVRFDDTGGYSKVFVSDVDGDTYSDLLLVSPLEIKVVYGGINGIAFGYPSNCLSYQITGGLNGSVAAVISDVTADGKSDIVMAVSNETNRSGAVIVLRREGDPPAREFNEAFRDARDVTNHLTVADMNHDGLMDIAVVLYSGGNVAFFLQRPVTEGGPFTNRVGLQLSGSGFGLDEILAHGDFNGDGYSDIALRSWDSVTRRSRVSLFIQEDRAVGFGPPIPFQCPNSCFHFTMGSSGDNLIDLSNYFHDDHGPIVYALVYQEMPQNLSALLDADGRHLDFIAAPGWYGVAKFRVSANDMYPGHLPIESNDFTVMVNAPPKIVSSPPTQISLGQEYKYQPVVSDTYPQDDLHTFILKESAPGTFVDVHSGLIRWRPSAVGNYTFSFVAIDLYGAQSDVQTFTVEVLPAPPQDTDPFRFLKDPISVAVLGTVVSTIALLGAVIGVSENAKYGFFALLVPLYSKIKREKVLDHFIRGQIFGYIMANPGEHYNAIKQALDITNGSLAHHLKTLEREKFIKSKRFGLYRRFYPWTMRVPEDGYFQLNEIQKNVLDLCRHQPGISQKEIAGSLGLTAPTINYHIAILAEHGYISVVRHGRRTHIYILRGGGNEAH